MDSRTVAFLEKIHVDLTQQREALRDAVMQHALAGDFNQVAWLGGRQDQTNRLLLLVDEYIRAIHTEDDDE